MKEKMDGEGIKRGDIFWCFPRGLDERFHKRMYVAISNNKACTHSSTIIMCPLTTKNKKQLPTHVKIKDINGRNATIRCEDPVLINKLDIMDFVCSLNVAEIERLNNAIKIALGIDIWK